MQISVVYLASLREQAGCAEESVTVPDHVTTVAALIEWLLARGRRPASALARTRAVRAAVNQRFAKAAQPLASGDEVAFFPPVTGG